MCNPSAPGSAPGRGAKRDALIRSMAERYSVLHWFIISVILGALAVMGFVVYRLLRATRA